MRVDRLALRLAALLSFLLTLFVWNSIFDRGIGEGVQRYLTLQRLHAAGEGPFVQMQDVMREAARRSAVQATLWSAPILVLGVVALGRMRDGGPPGR